MTKIVVNTNPRTLPDARTELERVAAEISVVEGQVAALETAKPEDSAAFKDLQNQLTTATERVSSLQTELNTANASVTTLQSTVTAKEGELVTARAAVTDFEQKVETKSKAKAIDFLAERGLSPAAIGLPTGEIKPPSQLKGRERTAAAFNKELTGKN